MSKKGGLQLGINTIVVLVIAIVLIGVGISLITGLTGMGEKKITGIFDNQDLKQPATRNRPLVLQEGKITGRFGEEVVVPIGFFNKHQTATNVTISIGECTKGLNATLDGISATEVKSGEGLGFDMIFKASKKSKEEKGKELDEGTYICSIVAKGKIGNKEDILASMQTDVFLVN